MKKFLIVTFGTLMIMALVVSLYEFGYNYAKKSISNWDKTSDVSK